MFTLTLMLVCQANVVYALDYVACGSSNGIPKPVPQLTTIAYTLLVVGVPIVLIIFSIVELVKSVFSADTEKILKARNKLFKKFFAAAIILIVGAIVQFAINKVTSNDKDKSSVAECLSCFLYYDHCEPSTSGNVVEEETHSNAYSNMAEPTHRIGKALTPEEVKEQFANMKVPTYKQLYSLAKRNYKMSEEMFEVVFGWPIGEGYYEDPYLSYLCACIGINFYMGYDIKTPDEMAAKIAGRDYSNYYKTETMQRRTINAKNNPDAYKNAYKIMYLALSNPDENAHDCDGVSNYSSYGGKVYYSSVIGGTRINVWTLWYDGIKNWKKEK